MQVNDALLPVFSLAPAAPGIPPLDTRAFRDGRPRIINFFGSWCGPCIDENRILIDFRRAGIIVEGIDAFDTPDALAEFLRKHGNPFSRIGADPDGDMTKRLKVGSFPTTLFVDGNGRVRFKYVGKIDPEDLPYLYATVAELGATRQ